MLDLVATVLSALIELIFVSKKKGKSGCLQLVQLYGLLVDVLSESDAILVAVDSVLGPTSDERQAFVTWEQVHPRLTQLHRSTIEFYRTADKMARQMDIFEPALWYKLMELCDRKVDLIEALEDILSAQQYPKPQVLDIVALPEARAASPGHVLIGLWYFLRELGPFRILDNDSASDDFFRKEMTEWGVQEHLERLHFRGLQNRARLESAKEKLQEFIRQNCQFNDLF